MSTSSMTVKARPVSFADILHLDGNPESHDVFYLTDVGTLSPATLVVFNRPQPEPEPESKRGRRSRRTDVYYAAIVDERATEAAGHTIYKPDVANGPVGVYLKVEVVDHFGTIHSGGMFTTAEAEEGAALTGQFKDPSRFRGRVYVADSRAEEMPLTPVFGSMITFSGIVADIDPDELAARADRALRAEFGPTLGRLAKVLTRPVMDRRVDVNDSVTGKTLAVGVLAAEVPLIKGASHVVTVADTNPNLIVGGG